MFKRLVVLSAEAASADYALLDSLVNADHPATVVSRRLTRDKNLVHNLNGRGSGWLPIEGEEGLKVGVALLY